MDKFFEFIKLLILGVVQGISEVLPISSSAHLVLTKNLLGIYSENLTLEVFLHLASLIAVIAFLWKRIVSLIKGFCLFVFKKDANYKVEFKICISLVISTLPIVIFSLLLKDKIELISSKIYIIGILLLINGLSLVLLTRIKGHKTIEEFNYLDALVIGTTQMAGVFPGISRSGSCLYGAFARRVDKNVAADYAFLLFIPSVLGAFVLEFDSFKSVQINQDIWMYIVAFIVTSIVTFLAFKILLKVIRKGKLSIFGYYCFAAGAFAIIYGLLK